MIRDANDNPNSPYRDGTQSLGCATNSNSEHFILARQFCSIENSLPSPRLRGEGLGMRGRVSKRFRPSPPVPLSPQDWGGGGDKLKFSSKATEQKAHQCTIRKPLFIAKPRQRLKFLGALGLSPGTRLRSMLRILETIGRFRLVACHRQQLRHKSVNGSAFLIAFLWMLAVVLCCNFAYAQQTPAWRNPQALSTNESQLHIRVALKPTTPCEKNVVELDDVADLSGSEAILQKIRNLPLGPAPARGSRQTWLREDILVLLKLRGIDEKYIRWAGDEACQVVRMDTMPPDKAIEYTPSDVSPQTISMAERTVASVIDGYLKSKSVDAASWTIKPIISNDYAKLLSQKRLIKGITGGVEPWTGEQQFDLLILTPHGEQSFQINAIVNVPTMVWGATGPLAKGRVIVESDLKLVRLTSAMKASDENCFFDAAGLIGKELRRSISTGQPILRTDAGPVRTIQARDQVEIQVVAGSVVVQTAGRAVQSGGVDDVIEVEIIGSKKRLAARVIQGNIVEAIAR